MLIRPLQSGLTLIELLCAVSIMLVALAFSAPSFSQWLRHAQIRTATESIRNGLHLARTEAMRRNRPVSFRLTDSSGRVAWTVGCVTVTSECAATIQRRASGEGASHARVGVSLDAMPPDPDATHFATALAAGVALPAAVRFDALGRVHSATTGQSITRIDITNAVAANSRRLVIVISPGGQIRACDPAVASSANPVACG